MASFLKHWLCPFSRHVMSKMVAQCVPASFGVKLLMTNGCEKIVQYSLRSYRQNFSSTMVKSTVLFVIFVIVFVACGPSDLLKKELTAVVDEVVDSGEFCKLGYKSESFDRFSQSFTMLVLSKDPIPVICHIFSSTKRTSSH